MYSLLQAGLNVTAIGMGVVFLLLTMLVFIIRGMSALSRMIEGAPGESLLPTATLRAPGSQSNQQLVSVISAAIAAYRKRH
jgi:sodium pump decarboxylase gamma subunit